MTYSTPNICPVVFLTADYCISGNMDLGDQRLSDSLNVRQGSKVSLRNGTLARLETPGTALRSDELVVVPRSRIVVAFEANVQSVPSAHRFYSYVNKAPCPVFVTAAGIQVSGNIQAAADFDPGSLSLAADDKFQPITQAVITFGGSERFRLEKDTVLVNLRHVEYIARRSAEASEKTDEPRKS